jgi:predicted restriction endonuclease
MIERDFDPEILPKAVSAVEQHLAYYEGASGNKQPGIRRILTTKYRHLLGGPQQEVAREAQRLKEQGEFDPDNLEDARRRVLASIARRQGQPEFRQTLLKVYRGRCAFSGTRVEGVLEAAHILGYQGPKTNHPANGLLLRSDLHTLFDLRLIAVDTDSMTLLLSPLLKGSGYQKLAGKQLVLPQDKARWPSKKALDVHRARSGL